MHKHFIPFLTFSIFAFAGCKSYKYYTNQQVEVQTGSQSFEFVNNQILMPVFLDGKVQKLLLDMGATASVIYDTSVIKDYYKKQTASFGSAKGAGKGSIKIKQLPLSFSDSLFESTNKVFTIIENNPFPKNPCTTGAGYAGLYGADFFKRKKLNILLDLESNTMWVLDEQKQLTTLQSGFTEIRSSFKNKGITIYLSINGKEYPFLFDTGFNSAVIMPFDEGLPFLNEPHFTIEGLQAKTVTGIVTGITDYYQEKKVSIAGTEYPTLVTVSHAMKSQNIGMGFIKGFSWLIDYKQQKVYLKKVPGNQSAAKTRTIKYFAAIVDNKIIVGGRDVYLAEYNVGAEIISVNGQAVNEENKCSLLELLNTNAEWKEMNVMAKDIP